MNYEKLQERLFLINEHELNSILNRLGIEYGDELKIEKAEIIASFIKNLSDDNSRYEIIYNNILLHGRMIFQIRIPDAPFHDSVNLAKYKKNNIGDAILYTPETLNELLANESFYVPNSRAYVVVFKKSFGNNEIDYELMKKKLNTIVHATTSNIFGTDFLVSLYAQINNKKLSSRIIPIDKANKFRLFYVAHKVNSDILSVSTKLSFGNMKIEKTIPTLIENDLSKIESIHISKRLQRLQNDDEFVKHYIRGIPANIQTKIQEIKINLLRRLSKNGIERYMFSFNHNMGIIYNIDFEVKEFSSLYHYFDYI